MNSDFSSLRQEQRILHVDTKVSDRVLYLGVTEQYLDHTDIARRPVDHRCLRAAKRVSSIFLRAQTDRGHPLVNEACILPRAHMFCVIDSAREYIVFDRAASPLQPGQKAGPHVARDLELDGTTRLLLNDDRSGSDFGSGDDITDPDLDQVAAAKLAVYRKIKQSAVTNAALTIEKEADGPDLLLRKRTLRADFPAGVPSCGLAAGIIILRMARVSSPRP